MRNSPTFWAWFTCTDFIHRRWRQGTASEQNSSIYWNPKYTRPHLIGWMHIQVTKCKWQPEKAGLHTLQVSKQEKRLASKATSKCSHGWNFWSKEQRGSMQQSDGYSMQCKLMYFCWKCCSAYAMWKCMDLCQVLLLSFEQSRYTDTQMVVEQKTKFLVFFFFNLWSCWYCWLARGTFLCYPLNSCGEFSYCAWNYLSFQMSGTSVDVIWCPM